MTAPTVHVPNPPPTTFRPRWSAWRVVLIVIGGVAAAFGIALLVAGGVLAVTASARNADGYLTAGPAPLRSDGYAITGREIGLQITGPDVAATRDLLGRVRIGATGNQAGTPIFVGIAPRDDVDRYLAGVRTDEFRDVDVDPFRVTYQRHDGGAPTTSPGEQTFWTASDSGTGDLNLTWNAAPGDWAVVIMNADGSAGIDADVSVGANLPVLRLVAVGLLVTGGMLLVTGAVLVAVPIATRPRIG